MNTRVICATFLFFLAFSAKAQFEKPQRGFTGWRPASSWEEAMISGNGTTGTLAMGNPHDETIIFSHALLYLPQTRSENLLPQGEHLEEIKQLLLDGKYQEASALPANIRKREGYHDKGDPFIPAFDLRLRHEAANIEKYQRSVNFETGETITDWRDSNGTFRRKVFVSRKDSIAVISITGSSIINVDIKFATRPVAWDQWAFIKEGIDSMKPFLENEVYLGYSASFAVKNHNTPDGYTGLGRVILKGGNAEHSGEGIKVKGADELLLIVKLRPYRGEEETMHKRLKDDLNEINATYDLLLNRHTDIHAKLYNRSRLSLNATQADRDLHAEELLLRGAKKPSPALIEQVYDAGRYNILSSMGTNPPNLQGLWSGTWTAPWSSDFTHDGNLPTAISLALPTNMPELMDAYFSYLEGHMDDFRENARVLFNADGIRIPAHTSGSGRDTDFGEVWCLTLWTAGAGWASSFFYDYWLYTNDTTFLRERAYPFMKASVDFYEDFLETGEDGQFVFNPSYSPENNPKGIESQATINSTMDVMVAKQLLRNTIAAAKVLHIDIDKIETWEAMLAAMPDYQVNADGVLSEWLWPGLEDNYRHRHVSQLYALFDGMDPDFRDNQELRAAAVKLLDKKMEFRQKEHGGEMAFGLVQLGLVAAHLGEADKVEEILNWLSSGRYWSSSMASYHNVGGLFNMDISGGVPYLISRALVYSEPDLIEIFPAIPSEWDTGKVEGLLLRGNVELVSLIWSAEEVQFELRSAHDHSVRIGLPPKAGKLYADGKIIKVNEVDLKAGVSKSFSFNRGEL